MSSSVRANHKTLGELVTGQLRSMILSGHFKPGDRLDEARLAQMLEVSRMPVRMALKELEVEGLVENQAYRGAAVKQLTAADISDIYELRVLLEEQATRLAAKSIKPERIARLEQTIEKMADAFRARDYTTFHTLNNTFHFHLYDACQPNRPRLLQAIRDLRAQSALAMNAYLLALPSTGEQAVKEHRGILDACARHDALEAGARTREHLERAMHVLVDLVKERADG